MVRMVCTTDRRDRTRVHTAPATRSSIGSSSCAGANGVARTGSAPELGVPTRTVSRVLARNGVPRLCTLDPITGEQIKASKTTAVRYERDRPGELVHMDVRKIGRIPDGGDWRAHGRGAGSIMRNRNSKVGFDYVHSLVDDHSRLAYSEILPDEKGTTCAAFLTQAIDYFPAHGITRIERLMTDKQRPLHQPESITTPAFPGEALDTVIPYG